MSPEAMDRVCAWYAAGESCGKIAARLGVARSTAWKALKTRGVTIRPPEKQFPDSGSPTKASQYEGGDCDTPKCPCGGRLSFETWDGYAREVCRSCGLGRTIQAKGIRRYDQRERLERFWAEEDERSEAVKAYAATRKAGRAPHLNVRREVA